MEQNLSKDVTENLTAAETQELREKYESLKKDISQIARLLKAEATGRVSEISRRGADWAKEHPATTIGIIAGISASIGFAMGLLVGRRA